MVMPGSVILWLICYPGWDPENSPQSGEIMEKGEKGCLLKISLLGIILLFFLSTVSCTPILIGQAAGEGALVVGAAASSESGKDPNENLKSSINGFNEAFQFEDYSQALAFVIPDKRKNFWSEADRFKGRIQIAKYELRDLELDRNKNHATALMYCEYWRPECPIVKTVSFKQKWQYSKNDKGWKVSVTGFGAFPSNSY